MAQTGKSYKVLSTQPTPNPDALKFFVNSLAISSGTKSFDSGEEAKGDAFAEALFALPGIRGIYVNQDYVSITKSMMDDWADLIEPIRETIEKYLEGYEPVSEPPTKNYPAEKISVTPEEFNELSNEERLIIVDTLLDETVRPALAADGGGLIVQTVEGNIVRIHYQGACGSCPSSTEGTLKAIQGILQKSLGPEIQVQTALI